MKDHVERFFEATGAAQMLPQLLVHADTGAIAAVNAASEAFYGWPGATMQSMLVNDLDASDSEASEASEARNGLDSFTREATSAKGGVRVRRSHRVAGGSTRQVELCVAPVTLASHALLHVVVLDAVAHDVIAHDVIAQHVIAQHVIAQHVIARDTVARDGNTSSVSSGARSPRRVVHDFNNLLTVLRGSAVFLHDAVDPTSQAGDDLAAIERATDRAEELLNELLAVIPKS